MARKTLLSESEIRQFMKLANIKPLQEMGGYDVPGMRDEEEDVPGMRDDMMEEEEGDEAPMPPDGEEMDMEMDAEPGGDIEMDMDMGEEPAADMDMDMDMDMGAGPDGGKEEQFADIVDKLADLLGLDADVEVGGDEEMGGEVEAEEGGDELDMADSAPEAGGEEEMDAEMEDDEEVMGEEDIVAEVARRVSMRLLREKKKENIANKLAERIFHKLASK